MQERTLSGRTKRPIATHKPEGMDMRKTIAVALALGLLVGAFVGTAEAGKKKKKKAPVRIEEVIELAYTGGDAGVTTPGPSASGCLNGADAFACKQIIPTQPGMTYIKIEVQDASGQKVGGFISQQDADGDTFGDGFGNFCGAHPEPIPLELASAPVDLSMTAGTCTDGSPSVVTSGKVIATFSNMP